MGDSMLDRTTRFAMRHEKAIGIAGFAWFWGGVAITARFVPVPDLPDWAKSAIFWSGAAWNAGWWGFFQPALERHKKKLLGPAASGTDHPKP